MNPALRFFTLWWRAAFAPFVWDRAPARAAWGSAAVAAAGLLRRRRPALGAIFAAGEQKGRRRPPAAREARLADRARPREQARPAPWSHSRPLSHFHPSRSRGQVTSAAGAQAAAVGASFSLEALLSDNLAGGAPPLERSWAGHLRPAMPPPPLSY